MGVDDRDEANSLIRKKGVMEIILALKKNGEMYKEELAVVSGLSSAWVDRQLERLKFLGIIDSTVEGRKKYFMLTSGRGKKVADALDDFDKKLDDLQDILG
ncbi:MAG: hypothetical protein R6U10_00985 [Thermoplasmatota archaeon]